jgi:DNA-binding NarL/FixJ family response regulator
LYTGRHEVGEDMFDAVEAALHTGRLDAVDAESRAAGAPVQRFPGDTDPLSAQQRRIAELAAAGWTSKQIAAQLSLSPRTIDTHLHRLFRKLGITRRAGLSAALRLYDSESDAAARGSEES